MTPYLRPILAVFAGLLLSLQAVAQNDNSTDWAKYAIHTGLGIVGYGGVFTINFEVQLWNNKENLQLRARSGYGYAGVGTLGDAREVWGVPIGLTALFGKRRHFFEGSLGFIVGYSRRTIQSEVSTGIGSWPLVDIAYRFELAPTGLILRANIGTSGIGGGIGVAF